MEPTPPCERLLFNVLPDLPFLPASFLLSGSLPSPLAVLIWGETGVRFAGAARRPELLSQGEHSSPPCYMPDALLGIFVLHLLLKSLSSGKLRKGTLSYTGCHCSCWVSRQVIPLLCPNTRTEGRHEYLLTYLFQHDVSSSFHSHLLDDAYVPATGPSDQGR